ncbi:hypothetical protein TNCV_948571 [Trichonephila clavipes]|nr:hypothetical protein TNCV_948571 [Trichonephila clavipes]
MCASSFSVNPTPLAHADDQRDVHPRRGYHNLEKKLSRNLDLLCVLIASTVPEFLGVQIVPSVRRSQAETIC